MALTQEQVVKRAVELMAEAGLEALTLRRLATDLGVSAPTLYWHVRNKRQLLDLMAEALVAQAGRSTSPAPGQPWWEWLAERARLQFRALISQRDAALVVAGNRPTKASLPDIEEVLDSLVAVAFPPAEALRVRAAIAGVDRPGPAVGDAGFEYGLGLLIEGVQARHAELLSAAPGPNSARVVGRFNLMHRRKRCIARSPGIRPTRADDATETSLPATGACAAV